MHLQLKWQLDNADVSHVYYLIGMGHSYWLKATLQYLRCCTGHYLFQLQQKLCHFSAICQTGNSFTATTPMFAVAYILLDREMAII